MVWFLVGRETRSYWLRVVAVSGGVLRATAAGQDITLIGPAGLAVEVLLSDALVKLDASVRVLGEDGSVLYEGTLARTILHVQQNLLEREDPDAAYSAEVSVTL